MNLPGARRSRPPVAEARSTQFSVGASVTIHGNVEFDGPIEIDGFVHGEVRGTSVIVSRYGTVSGLIAAGDVTVCGGVSGAIYAERLVLKPQCDVEGEICYRELALEDGCYFEGKSRPHQKPLEVAAIAADNSGSKGAQLEF